MNINPMTVALFAMLLTLTGCGGSGGGSGGPPPQNPPPPATVRNYTAELIGHQGTWTHEHNTPATIDTVANTISFHFVGNNADRDVTVQVTTDPTHPINWTYGNFGDSNYLSIYVAVTNPPGEQRRLIVTALPPPTGVSDNAASWSLVPLSAAN